MPIADVKQKECLYRCQLKPTLGDCYHDLFESTRCSLTSMAHLHVRRKLGLVQCLHMDGRMKLVLFTLVLPKGCEWGTWLGHSNPTGFAGERWTSNGWKPQTLWPCSSLRESKSMLGSVGTWAMKHVKLDWNLRAKSQAPFHSSPVPSQICSELSGLPTALPSFKAFALRWAPPLRRSAPPLCRRMPCTSTGSSPRGPWRCRPRNCRRRRDRIAVKSQHFHPGRKSSQGMPGYARVCQGMPGCHVSRLLSRNPVWSSFWILFGTENEYDSVSFILKKECGGMNKSRITINKQLHRWVFLKSLETRKIPMAIIIAPLIS